VPQTLYFSTKNSCIWIPDWNVSSCKFNSNMSPTFKLVTGTARFLAVIRSHIFVITKTHCHNWISLTISCKDLTKKLLRTRGYLLCNRPGGACSTEENIKPSRLTCCSVRWQWALPGPPSVTNIPYLWFALLQCSSSLLIHITVELVEPKVELIDHHLSHLGQTLN
jgi:hypothetical protein